MCKGKAAAEGSHSHLHETGLKTFMIEIDCGLISTFNVEFIDFTKLCYPTNATLFQKLKTIESSGIKILFYIAKDCHMHKLLEEIIDIPVNINDIYIYSIITLKRACCS